LFDQSISLLGTKISKLGRYLFFELCGCDPVLMRMRQRRHLQIPTGKFFFVLLFIFVFCFQATLAGADEFDIIPFVALRQEYNDNLFFSVNDEIDDFITIITLGLEFDKETERILAELTGRIDRVLYAENDVLDATDQYYAGNLSYQITPRFSLLTEAGYSKDSRIDSDIAETGLVLRTAARERIRFVAGGNYFVTETTATSLTYLYDDIEYEDPEFVDSQEHSFNLGYNHQLDKLLPTTMARINLRYTQWDFKNSLVDYYGGTLGGSWDYSEMLRLLFDFGIRYTRTEFAVGPNQETSKDWGGVGYLNFSYRGELTDVYLAISHDIKPASGRGGTTVNTSVAGRIAQNFSDKLSAFLFATYYKNKSKQGQLSAENINERTFRIRSGLYYDFNQDISLEAGYQYTFVKDLLDYSEATRNLVYGEIRWQWPLLN
jgi:hypothetical protein